MSISSSSETEAHIFLYAGERTDHSIKLGIRAFAEGFCARGAAFFSVTEIENFLSALGSFPLVGEQFISGGYFDDTGNNIDSEHFHISVSPLNATGLLAMKVRAYTPHPEYWKKGFGAGGRCSYFLQYEDLRKFVDKFEHLAGGKSTYFEFNNFRNI
ncbi:hypothetical protein [Methylocapsa aurea]|jgi:hypothetical protein|uniref:hypothetical protein n=1 Tax=Methylocapsa aurea TaxID=663610 RepID=UPI003D188F8D